MDVGQTLQNLLPHGLRRPEKGRTPEDAAGEKIHNAHRVAAVKGRALRHVADTELRLRAVGGVEGDLALIFPLTEDGADERRFARTVRADERDHLPAVHVQVDVIQNGVAADMDGQVFNFQAAGVAAVACMRVCMRYHPSASRMVSMF